MLKKSHINHTKKSLSNKVLRKVNRKKFKLLIEKWQGISNSHNELKKLLPYFIKVTKKETYKDIDTKEIYQKIEETKHLKKSFDYYKHEINKNDKHK